MKAEKFYIEVTPLQAFFLKKHKQSLREEFKPAKIKIFTDKKITKNLVVEAQDIQIIDHERVLETFGCKSYDERTRVLGFSSIRDSKNAMINFDGKNVLFGSKQIHVDLNYLVQKPRVEVNNKNQVNFRQILISWN